MMEQTGAAAAAEEEAPAKDLARKKKSRRSTAASGRKEGAGLSNSSRLSASKDTCDGDEQAHRRRRRSKSTDRLKGRRRDSGGNSKRDKDRTTSTSRDNARAEKSRSPRRVRKTKNDNMDQSGTSLKDRSQQGSLNHSSPSEAAPRLPRRTVSESSDFQTALEATNERTASKAGNGANNVEEASLGDFQKYAQQQQQKNLPRYGNLPGRSPRMGDIAEESLGSFTAFAKKYEDEKLMGLHDDEPTNDLYTKQQDKLSQPISATCSHDDSFSLGGIMKNSIQKYGETSKAPKTPVIGNSDSITLGGLMKSSNGRYGSSPQAPVVGHDDSISLGGLMKSSMEWNGGSPSKTSPGATDESLGSFAAFNQKYEQEKKFCFHDSTMRGLPPVPEQDKEGSAPEERMDSFTRHATEPKINDDNDSKRKSKRKSGGGEEKENENLICLPESRIEKVGKRGGIAYKIMVDSPGGHKREPMKIVVALGFEEDDTDSEDEENGPEQATIHVEDQDTEIDNSSHLPMELDNDSESEDQVQPLGQPLSRWREQTKRVDPGTLKKPMREKSCSNHSTGTSISSVTLGSSLERQAAHIQIQVDACPSNPRFQRKPPGYTAKSSMKRKSGMTPSGGTASLMMLTPHNLGTRKGLLLRQQSQASMKSAKSSKSTDSSWNDPNQDVPDDYEASFLQLNLLDLEKTEMQTNEEVEQAELPQAFLADAEGMLGAGGNEENLTMKNLKEQIALIPKGKDPNKASSELLGMKTMLKTIKRAAPKRTLSFDFDKETPKQIWNNMFARAKKGDLAGAQYIDNGDDSSENLDAQMENGTIGEAANPAKPENTTEKTTATGFFNSILKKATAEPPGEKSTSKGKSSLWSSAMKQIASGKETSLEQSEVANEKSKDEIHEDQEGGINDEASIGIDDFGHEEKEFLEYVEEFVDDHHNDKQRDEDFVDDDHPASGRSSEKRRSGGSKAKDASSRGSRSTRHRAAAKAQDVLNRSAQGTLSSLVSDQEDTEVIAPKDGTEDTKRRPKIRVRRRLPNRTNSDDTAGRRVPTRLNRTRSHDSSSPVRSGREFTMRMNQSLSSFDMGDRPRRTRPTRSRRDGSTDEHDFSRRMNQSLSSVDPNDFAKKVRPPKPRRDDSADQPATNEFRDIVKKMQSSFSGLDPSDLPSRPARAKTKPRTLSTGHGKEGSSRATRSGDKVQRVPRKHRTRRKSEVDTEAPVVDPIRGLELPEDATEDQLREMLGYDE